MFVRAPLALLAVALGAAAQSTTTAGAPASTPSLSACLLQCFTSSQSSGTCASFTDVSCACSNTAFQQAVASCVVSACPDQIAAATSLQSQECGSLSSASGSSTTSASSSASTTTTTTSTSTSTSVTSLTSASGSGSSSGVSTQTTTTGTTTTNTLPSGASTSGGSTTSSAANALVPDLHLRSAAIAAAVGALGLVFGGFAIAL